MTYGVNSVYPGRNQPDPWKPGGVVGGSLENQTGGGTSPEEKPAEEKPSGGGSKPKPSANSKPPEGSGGDEKPAAPSPSDGEGDPGSSQGETPGMPDVNEPVGGSGEKKNVYEIVGEEPDLFKKLDDIMKFCYGDSGVSSAHIVSAGGEAILYADNSNGIVAPPVETNPGGGGGGSGQGEDDRPRYSIYIDAQTEPVEQGIYSPDPQNLNQYMWNFIVEKCLNLLWADNDKQLFSRNHIKKFEPENDTPWWRLRTIRIKFDNVYEYMTYDFDKTDIDDLLEKMKIMHVINYIYHYVPVKTETSIEYKFNFGASEKDEAVNIDNDFKHTLRQALAERSKIRNVISNDNVNRGNIETYLNAIYRESQKRINEIKSSAKGQSDVRGYVFDELAKNFFYDEQALKHKYDMGNNLQTALATNISMCHGMSTAYAKIMSELGIQIGLIDSAKNVHAWNYEIETKDEKREGFWYDLAFQVSHPSEPNPARAFYQFKNNIRYYSVEVNGRKQRTAYVTQEQYKEEDRFVDDLKAYIFSNGLPIERSVNILEFRGDVFKQYGVSKLHTPLGDIPLE